MQLLQENLSFANVQEVKALSGDLFNHKCSTVFSLTERKKTMSLFGLHSHLLMHANAFKKKPIMLYFHTHVYFESYGPRTNALHGKINAV